MYDLILDIGCCCSCECEKPLTNIVNNQGFTPLTLAAKLAKKEVNIILHSLMIARAVWCTGIQLTLISLPATSLYLSVSVYITNML